MNTAHTIPHKPQAKPATNGPGHHATMRDMQMLVMAIDDLIRARIAHVRDAGAGPEESDKLHLALIEHFRRLFG